MEHIYQKREPVDDLADKIVERMNGALKPKTSWWSTWGSTVTTVAVWLAMMFFAWHELDKRISMLEHTMNRIEGAVGRIEDSIWPKK